MAEQCICHRSSGPGCGQELHEIPFRIVAVHQISEVAGVLFDLANLLPNPAHAFEGAAG
jgi:hypothetical protein